MKAGIEWRILAYPVKGRGSTNLYSRALWKRHAKDHHPDTGRTVTETDQVFDELVISPWLHLEQMDDGKWWIDLGGYHLWINVSSKGVADVSHNGSPLSDYGLRADE